MTLCEKCIHREVCNIRGCHDENDERALTYCADFKNNADFVEVVRCKDCIHYKETGIGEFDKPCGVCKVHIDFWDDEPIEVWETDFCSCGERKDK